MDIRVSVSSAPLDYSMTEFAKECTSRKYCLDKLILVLVSKLYLKSLLKNLKSAPTDLYVPLTQIMRFDCHLLHLALRSALEMKAQIGDAQTKKHISKVDDLWVRDNCNWDDETKDAEDIHDEEENEEEEEGDGIDGEEK
ncbi:hypothetical protein G6F57_001682 [Rhizopus arrhizus]|uniref:Uncharacterized protein n=1 Tax=Rhizopus oryzae TaxID=64495 RepID=A0A9P6XDC2_RHIOR|nr:hypothetical protein G6F23_004840 [Rhizopus arrhizus]KAG1423183.1 hypothetical protein G6F58_002940 [Rhizopus delemar]KAG0763961.1 hypothetical protein G6F24_005605 [Rhizopus arrhizus]KAG0785170.1 hypothetical protein G6F22_008051 [Rhizopus arrhizus]KAG0786758.1 hypothetical protein G6F21_008369 [Rhizopus arrhizus]